jgi:hypothetical protein
MPLNTAPMPPSDLAGTRQSVRAGCAAAGWPRRSVSRSGRYP